MVRRALDRERWLRLWSRLDAGIGGDTAFDRLSAAYAESHRVYHTAEHIRNCLDHLDEVPPVSGAASLEAAIWLHDAVYDPHREDNEAASAALAAGLLDDAGVAQGSVSEVQRLILLTRHLEIPTDPAGRLLCDIDLAILGVSPAEFEEFERSIRAEYAWVPDGLYREARSRILARFLTRPTLYQTGHFQARYEESARQNLRYALAKLRQ
jgi:predicted metal-dependent HD superfamily phosphohydrolase